MTFDRFVTLVSSFVKRSQIVVFRMDRAIDSLEKLVTQQSSDTTASALSVLPVAQSLLAMKPLQSNIPLSSELVFKDELLNDSQKQAVKFALESPEVSLVCTL